MLQYMHAHIPIVMCYGVSDRGREMGKERGRERERERDEMGKRDVKRD